MGNVFKFWTVYIIVILFCLLTWQTAMRMDAFSTSTHTNSIQALLNANAGGIAHLIEGDTYIEDSQVIIPINTTLDGNGATIKSHPSFYQNTYSGSYDLHKFLFLMKNGSNLRDFTIDGDNKQLWGGIVVEGDNCSVEDVNVTATWFSGVWFEDCNESNILRGTMTDAANVPGNWATGMVEMRDVNNIMIDGVTFIDTKSIGCGGVKAKPKSVQGVRILTNVTIQNCTFDLFKWHGWVNDGGKVIGNYAIELSKNDLRNIQILNNTMNTTISVAGDYNHEEDYNYGKLIVKGNHIYPTHASANILETSQSGVVFEDNFIQGGGYVISNFLNWTTQGVIDPYFNLRFNNNVFDFIYGRPTALFRFAREYNTVEFKRNTIYGPTGIREILNFADATCDGTNIDFNNNLVTCFGSTTMLKSGNNYTNLNTSDNKWYGEFSGVSQNVNDIPFKNSGTKPFPFFTSLYTGYGAAPLSGIPPPSSGVYYHDSFENPFTEPPWRTYVGQNTPTISTNYKLSGNSSMRMYIPIRLDYTNARAQAQFWGANGVPIYAGNDAYTGIKFAIYIPNDFKADLWNEYYFQHKNVKEDSHNGSDNNPPFAMGVHGKNYSTNTGLELYANVRSISKNPSTSADVTTRSYDNIATIVPGQWHYFTVNTYWNYTAGGHHKVYMGIGHEPTQSDLILNYSGPTGYNSEYCGSTYLNVYKWDWNDSGRALESQQSGVTKREIYFEDFSIKDSAFDLNDGPIIPPIEPPIETSDTLIITGTDLKLIYK